MEIKNSLPAQIAGHLREVYFGGNWTDSNLKGQLAGVTWRQATTKLHSYNTIAALVYHINYYVEAVSRVLDGGRLEAKDAHSFNHPPIQSAEEWQALLDKLWHDGERFAELIEKLPEEKLWDDFTEKKYGSCYRNLQGVIEHTHYHLGQIVLIKKTLMEDESSRL